MVNKDLGRISVILRGEYYPAAQYERLDCVSYEGSSYLVRKACQGIPPEAGEYYQLAALAGSSAAADAAAEVALQAAEGADASAARADAAAGNAQAAADAVAGDVKQIKDDVAAQAEVDTALRADLDVLWKLNAGISYDFVTDSEEGYEKTVPAGAKAAAVEAIGGHTEVIDDALVSADVESVKYNDTVVCGIPETVRGLPGYGWSAGDVCNSVEKTADGWQYVQRVSRHIYTDTEKWTYSATTNRYYSIIVPKTKMGSYNAVANVIISGYNVKKMGDVTSDMAVMYINDSTSGFAFRNKSIATVDEFTQHMAGKVIYYELAEPVVTDITAMMADYPEAFEVEAGGTLTFENAANLPVPSTVEYLRSLKEVNV